MSRTKQVEEKEVAGPDVITSVLNSIKHIDAGSLEKASKLEDTEMRRTALAKLIMNSAHKNEMLKGVKSVSTMREILYNLIAVKTLRAKEFHKNLNAKLSDTLSEIGGNRKARIIFSSLYPKKFQEAIG